MSILQKVWSVLTHEIAIQDVIEGSAEAFKNTLELAGKLQEHETELEAIAPLVGELDSALDVLNSPLMEVAGAAVPFLPLATGLLKGAIAVTRKEPELKDEVLLVAQVAYVEAVRCFLQENQNIAQQLTQPASAELRKKIRRVGKETELSDRDIRDVLLCFHRSEVAGKFEALLQERLEDSGLAAGQAALTARRIIYSVHRHLKAAVSQVQDEAKQLAAIYGEGWQRDLEAYDSIDRYLQTQIAGLPQETVFDEVFTFREVYVPSAVLPVVDGEVQKNEARQNIEEWARGCLLDEDKAGQVLFIQGGPGRGKSVFCRMFADRVWRELYPIFTPILIRLRDGIDLKRNFDEALASAIGCDFVTSDSGWLTDLNTRYLFILDGFDELFLEQGGKGSVQELLEQVSSFQERSARNPERGHRILITGRPLALYGIERQMPTNLDWVSIALMDKTAQAEWLERWREVTDPATSEAFRDFVWNADCPEQLQKLSQEPLLLYLLAKMHRDGAVDVNLFRSDDANTVKVEVYEAAVKWVLTRQRPDRLNDRLTELDSEELRAVLAEAGLCVVQSGNERALIAMIEDRLVQRGDTEAADLIKAARSSKTQNPLKNALAAFYLKAGETENSVEFFHKSFGEFLCAERLAESFLDWTEPGKRRRSTYAINDSEFEWQVYDLLGYGHLSQEILDYVMVLLKRQLSDVQWVALFERLNDFYLRWSDGEFIEAIDVERILPLEKARQMQKWGIELGQRQANVFTGLNLLKILLKTHQYAQKKGALKAKISFHPCGNPEQKDNENEFQKTRFLQVIHYSDSAQARTSYAQICHYLNCVDLRNTNLSNANLSFADLSNANLSFANLIFTNLILADLSNANLSNADLSLTDLRHANLKNGDLRNADLSDANLRNADLRNADLSDANLSDADLRNADLRNADLSDANLRNADLRNADLSDANLRNADLSDANLSKTDLSEVDLRNADLSRTNLSEVEWDSETRWADATGLEIARNVPETLLQHPPFAATLALNQSYALAGQGEIPEAVVTCNKVQALDPTIAISSSFWNHLCWNGCLHDRADLVLFAGEKLVKLEPNDCACLDTRAVARAMTGDLAGAVADFETAIQDDYFQQDDTLLQKRERWLTALRNGENPFTPEELAKLRAEEG